MVFQCSFGLGTFLLLLFCCFCTVKPWYTHWILHPSCHNVCQLRYCPCAHFNTKSSFSTARLKYDESLYGCSKLLYFLHGNSFQTASFFILFFFSSKDCPKILHPRSRAKEGCAFKIKGMAYFFPPTNHRDTSQSWASMSTYLYDGVGVVAELWLKQSRSLFDWFWSGVCAAIFNSRKMKKGEVGKE